MNIIRFLLVLLLLIKFNIGNSQDSLFKKYMLSIDSNFKFEAYENEVTSQHSIEQRINSLTIMEQYVFYTNMRDSGYVGYITNFLNDFDTIVASKHLYLFYFSFSDTSLALFSSINYNRCFQQADFTSKIIDVDIFNKDKQLLIELVPSYNERLSSYLTFYQIDGDVCKKQTLKLIQTFDNTSLSNVLNMLNVKTNYVPSNNLEWDSCNQILDAPKVKKIMNGTSY